MKHLEKIVWPLLGVTASVAAYFAVQNYRRRKIEIRLQSDRNCELTEKEWKLLKRGLKKSYADHARFIRFEEIKTGLVTQVVDSSDTDVKTITHENGTTVTLHQERPVEPITEPVPGIDLPRVEVISQEEYGIGCGFEQLPLYFYRWDGILCDDAGIPIAPQYWELYIPDGLIDKIRNELRTNHDLYDPVVYIRNYDLSIDFEMNVVDESYVNVQSVAGEAERLETDEEYAELDDAERRINDEYEE